MKASKQILMISSLLCMIACSSNTLYTHYSDIPDSTWNQDSILRYSFEIKDTCLLYDIIFHIRHTDCYPYQNMWLFVQAPSLEEHSYCWFDTIEFYLANDRGCWLGNGRNGLIEMPVLYEQEYHFSLPGKYTIGLQQGMREQELNGLSNIGIEIISHNGKE